MPGSCVDWCLWNAVLPILLVCIVTCWRPLRPHLFFFSSSCRHMVMCVLVMISFICKIFLSSHFSFPVPAFCQEDELKCANHECVSRDRWCDGRADCLDSSDEWDCGKLLVLPPAVHSSAPQPCELNEAYMTSQPLPTKVISFASRLQKLTVLVGVVSKSQKIPPQLLYVKCLPFV